MNYTLIIINVASEHGARVSGVWKGEMLGHSVSAASETHTQTHAGLRFDRVNVKMRHIAPVSAV